MVSTTDGAVELGTSCAEAVPAETSLRHRPTACKTAPDHASDADGSADTGEAGLATVELWGGSISGRVITIDGPRSTVGSDPDSADIVVDDPTVSALHAALERIGATWLVRDLGSRNGIKLNGAPLSGQTRLRTGDTLHLGRTRLVFRDVAGRRPVTETLAEPPPDLTRAERRVLVELCRPLLAHRAFQPPASVREIAARLFVGPNAVQNHLANLYDKFDIHDDDRRDRRVRLANEAIRRGAVTVGDLQATSGTGDDDG